MTEIEARNRRRKERDQKGKNVEEGHECVTFQIHYALNGLLWDHLEPERC